MHIQTQSHIYPLTVKTMNRLILKTPDETKKKNATLGELCALCASAVNVNWYHRQNNVDIQNTPHYLFCIQLVATETYRLPGGLVP